MARCTTGAVEDVAGDVGRARDVGRTGSVGGGVAGDVEGA
jgi:hypothetical protein